jgi:SAM-dependent methyltransferase
LVRVTPVVGPEIYDDAYYAGRGADPYVNYAAEYADFAATDRRHELADLARVAGEFFAGAGATGENEAKAGRALRWLDFGCGAGGLLKYLREHGVPGGRAVEASGHDVGSYAEKLARADGFRIWSVGELATMPAGGFDVVSLVEVLEHISDPGEVVALCARVLRPGGLLLVTTGNVAGPIARRRRTGYRYCIPEIHVSLFSPAALVAIYARHGLRAQAVQWDGCVRFKALKSVPMPWRSAAAAVLRVPGVLRLVDRLYAVSAMPCAVRAAEGA